MAAQGGEDPMTAVPATRTWVAGEVVTAAHFNINIRDVFNFLLSPPILEVRQTVSQTGIVDSTWTAFTFTTEDVDSSGMHSTSVNTSRFVAVYPGWYDHGGGLNIEANATGQRGTRWAVNGTAKDGSETMLNTSATQVTGIPLRLKKFFFNVTDYSEAQVWQNSGGNRVTGVLASQMPSVSIGWKSN
jgi:hypothetical protein